MSRPQLEARMKNVPLEHEVLHFIINKEDDRLLFFDSIKSAHFSDTFNQEIYDFLTDLHIDGYEVNYIGIISHVELRAKPSRLKSLIKTLKTIQDADITDTPDNMIMRITELHKNRVIYEGIIQDANRDFISNEPIDDIIANISNTLLHIETGRKELKTDEVTQDVVESILHPESEFPGKQIGIHDFDMIYGGVKEDTQFVIGGEPGSGKTAIVVDFVYRLCTRYPDDVAILFYSYEMSEKRIIKRLISRMTGLSNRRLDGIGTSLSATEKEDIINAGLDIRVMPLQIVYDTLDTTRLRLRARKFALQNKGKHLIYFLDHIGLIEGTEADIRKQTIKASGTMKSFCRDYGATTFVLTQLKKELASKENARNYHMPNPSHIMESGSIKSDADNVMLLWRPEMRFATIAYHTVEDWSTANKLIIINDKNRDGQAPTHIVTECDIKSNKIEDCKNPFI
jgi:replicative DNA helicase